jgi:hypothetical protein
LTDDAPQRRSADVRLAIVERDIKRVLEMVTDIDKALRFPENSAVGRQLVERADRNAEAIGRHDTRIEELEDRVTELVGVAKALRIASLLIGIAIGIFTLSQILP